MSQQQPYVTSRLLKDLFSEIGIEVLEYPANSSLRNGLFWGNTTGSHLVFVSHIPGRDVLVLGELCHVTGRDQGGVAEVMGHHDGGVAAPRASKSTSRESFAQAS